MAVIKPKSVTAINEEPIALINGMPVPSMIPGTIRNPPPMPKKPAMPPIRAPMAITRGAIVGVRRTSALPPEAFGRSIADPTATMISENKISKDEPPTCLPMVEPIAAPTMPERANTLAQGHFTLPSRQCAGPDRDMRIRHADDVKQQRRGQDRSAATEQAERQSDDDAGSDRRQAWPKAD